VLGPDRFASEVFERLMRGQGKRGSL
jgi:hypothetical protein